VRTGVISQLLLLDAQDPTADITLLINSPGGSVTAGRWGAGIGKSGRSTGNQMSPLRVGSHSWHKHADKESTAGSCTAGIGGGGTGEGRRAGVSRSFALCSNWRSTGCLRVVCSLCVHSSCQV